MTEDLLHQLYPTRLLDDADHVLETLRHAERAVDNVAAGKEAKDPERKQRLFIDAAIQFSEARFRALCAAADEAGAVRKQYEAMGLTPCANCQEWELEEDLIRIDCGFGKKDNHYLICATCEQARRARLEPFLGLNGEEGPNAP